MKINMNLRFSRLANWLGSGGVVLVLLSLMLIANRYFPYFLHGPYGFGYDMGIYKKTFEDITSFSAIFSSKVSILPSFFAYVFNLFSIPLGILLYHFHVFASVLIALPLYLITKECFGKREGIFVVALFSASYVQILASEFYLYKAVLGAVFLLFAFYFYIKKSKWFYLFLVLLSLTQLPQMLVLCVALGVSAFFNWKEYKSFYIYSLLFLGLSAIILLIFNPQHLVNALNVVWLSLNGVQSYDSHLTGLFLNLKAFLHRASFIILLGTCGIVLAFLRKNRKSLPLKVAVIFLSAIVFLKLFFENRFIEELDLLFMPFVAYFAVYLFDKMFKKSSRNNVIAAVMMVVLAAFLHFHYYKSTFSALSPHEIWAIDYIKEKQDSEYTMVTDTFYATWLYGYSGKTVLAPGIFENVWNYDQWMKYHGSTDEEKIQMHLDISQKYGKYYLYIGGRQGHPELQSRDIKKIFDVGGAVVYEVNIPSPEPVEELDVESTAVEDSSSL